MSRYMLIYKGKATDPSEMSPEAAAKVMEGWRAWMGKVGSALVDVGTPFGEGTSVVDDGSSADAIALSGFSIVEAGSLAEARTHAASHPFLSEGEGNYAVEVYEMLPVPFEA
ncbi:MAG: YciI family protein [Candidatus Limnocylindria bacterium]